MLRRTSVFVFALFVVSVVGASADDQTLAEKIQSLPWQSYPGTGSISTVATISLKNDLTFLDDKSTSTFLELNGNPARENEYTLSPRTGGWFAIFSYNDSGYVKDDEKLDPDALLSDLKAQNQDDIVERKKLNMPILTLTSWLVPPHYDVQTHRLEWGTKLVDEKNEIVANYTTRILGRGGVITGTLVSDPEHLQQDITDFHAALQNLTFDAGQTYGEYQPGDHLAEYGLGALVVGGAAAAAAKSGAFAGLIKVILVPILAVFAAVSAFFRRIFKRKSSK